MSLSLNTLPPWLLLSGGFAGSQLLGWGRSAASLGWGWLVRGSTSSLVVDEHEGSAFYWLLTWCQHYLPKATHLLALHRRSEVEYGPAPGLYVLRYQGRRVLLEREQYSAGPSGEGRPLTRLRLTVLGKHQALFRQILAEGERLHQPEDERLHITVQSGGYWGLSFREAGRPLDTVLLDADLKRDLVSDVAHFLENEDWYRRLCIPWQRGYLLYGPPGNGKTSLIRALASAFKLPLYMLNLADPKVGDGELAAMLQSVGRAVVVLEDIDTVLPGRSATGPRENLTFSGLLNALDGLVSVSGRIVFMTTNHPEELPPALVRPGRIDRRVLVENPAPAEIAALFARFFPEATDWIEEVRVNLTEGLLSMATVQGALLEHPDNEVQAFVALMRLHQNPPPLVLPPVRYYGSGENVASPAPCPPQVPQNTLAVSR